MRELTYIKKDVLRWQETDEPTLQASTDALVRPFAAARCDADGVFLFHNHSTPIRLGVCAHYLDPISIDMLGKQPFGGPIAVGHECVAEVISLGSDVSNVRSGDHVIVPWAISCGACENCRRGLTSRCASHPDTLLNAYGFGSCMGPWGGMISDLIRVPHADYMLVPVPEDLDPASIASAGDNIADAWRTVAPVLKEYPQAPVLVVGGGARSIGLYAAGIAVALGSSRVDYIDFNPARLEIAESLGANCVQIRKRDRSRWFRKNAPRIGGNYLCAADASAYPAGLRFAIRSLAPGGICTSVGFYFKSGTKIPFMQMYLNDTTLRTGVSHSRANLPELLDFLSEGKFKPEKVTTLVADWEDAPTAYLERSTKVILKRDTLTKCV